jgi:hypothetical protein
VSRFRGWLGSLDAAGLSDRERVDVVAELERLKGAASGAQARFVDEVRRSREVAAPQDAARSIGSEVALARSETPTCGDRFVRVSRALVHEMPHTLRALSSGRCSEAHATKVVEATSCLSPADRAVVDARVGPLLERLGVRASEQAARRVAAGLDAAAVVRRMEAAVASRRVTMRAAPDGMAYLTVLGPITEVVGAHEALAARARTVVAGHADDEPHQGRGTGAVATDTALALLSGRTAGQVQPVEVHLVMTDRALLGTGDPTRSVMEPARLLGHGTIPAPAARWWVRGSGGEGSGDATRDRDDAGVRAARVWVRRLYTSTDGRDLVAMDSRRRVFGGLLRRMLVLRDDLCTTPGCGAAIAHADHATPHREGSATSYTEGNGKCARCNLVKEAPGWVTRVVTDGSARSKRLGREMEIRTPLGRVYRSASPPLLGWGSELDPRGRREQTRADRVDVAAVTDAGRGSVVRQRSEAGEQHGLGDAHLLELPEVQRLVGAVGPGVGVLHAGHEDGGVRELLGEGRDERDRPADTDVHRLHAPRVVEGRSGLVVHGPLRVGGEAEPPVVEGHLDPGAPGRVREQVRLDQVERVQVELVRREADRHLRRDAGHEGVRRRRHRRRVDADGRDRRLGPDP